MSVHKNKEHLETLRQNLIELFAGSAHDVRAVIAAPDVEAAPAQDAALNNTSALDIIIGQPLPRSHYIKEFAKNIASKYSSAYALCRSEEALERDGAMLADGLIARWGQAQMLTVMPELIDDPDPGIQNDIAHFLERAERVFASFDQRGRNAKAHDNNDLGHVFAGTGATDAQDTKLLRLTRAADVLANVQRIAMNATSPEASVPSADI